MPSSTVMPAAIKAGRKSVLVSGASFAGLATAYWLNRLGHSVTIVETASNWARGEDLADTGSRARKKRGC